MKTLVLGGTKFFGKRLVKKLLEDGHKVTVASRGNEPVESGSEHIIIDRDSKESLQKLTNNHWDVVFDQIGFTSQNSKDLAETLGGHFDHLVYTSSMSVYDPGQSIKEEVFDPYTYDLRMIKKNEVGYAEGKRQAEAYYFQKCDFTTTAVRFPIVMGLDDRTRRLIFHQDKIAKGEEIYFPDMNARSVFIDSEDAASFLKWCGEKKPVGPINAASPEPISVKVLMERIAKQAGKEFIPANEVTDENRSPYGFTADWYMDVTRAESLGYKFKSLDPWLNELIEA